MGEVFDRKSLYARNKLNPDAIVCSNNMNGENFITKEFFASEAEFRFWKEWSDSDYHMRAKGDNREHEHTVSLHALSEEVGADLSPEDIILVRYACLKRGRAAAAQVRMLQSIITEKQFRRLWMYSVVGMTQREISQIEKANQRRISKSIIAAKNKIIKFFLRVQNRG
jgi:hypothetical protein